MNDTKAILLRSRMTIKLIDGSYIRCRIKEWNDTNAGFYTISGEDEDTLIPQSSVVKITFERVELTPEETEAEERKASQDRKTLIDKML